MHCLRMPAQSQARLRKNIQALIDIKYMCTTFMVGALVPPFFLFSSIFASVSHKALLRLFIHRPRNMYCLGDIVLGGRRVYPGSEHPIAPGPWSHPPSHHSSEPSLIQVITHTHSAQVYTVAPQGTRCTAVHFGVHSSTQSTQKTQRQ